MQLHKREPVQTATPLGIAEFCAILIEHLSMCDMIYRIRRQEGELRVLSQLYATAIYDYFAIIPDPEIARQILDETFLEYIRENTRYPLPANLREYAGRVRISHMRPPGVQTTPAGKKSRGYANVILKALRGDEHARAIVQRRIRDSEKMAEANDYG